MLKKIETRSVKTKNPLVKYKSITDIILLTDRNRVFDCFYRDYAKAERNTRKWWQTSKIRPHFLKTNEFKVIRDNR